MKKFLVFMLFLMGFSCAYAQENYPPDTTGSAYPNKKTIPRQGILGYNASNKEWVPIQTDASGSLSVGSLTPDISTTCQTNYFVSTTSVQSIPILPNRKFITIINHGNITAWLDCDKNPIIGQSIPVYSNNYANMTFGDSIDIRIISSATTDITTVQGY